MSADSVANDFIWSSKTRELHKEDKIGLDENESSPLRDAMTIKEEKRDRLEKDYLSTRLKYPDRSNKSSSGTGTRY